jgi:tetratricopeptide (TPR) repeat protein
MTVEVFIKKVKEHQNRILAIIGLVAAISGGVFGYFYYKKMRAEAAYAALTEALEYFDAPVKKDGDSKEKEVVDDFNFLNKKEFTGDSQKWEKVNTVFKTGYEAHKSSGVAPFFLVYRAEALVKLNNLPEAIEVMRAALSRMPNHKVKSYYNVKLALMLVDVRSAVAVEEGVKILKEIARDDKNIAHDMALYFLGEYFWYEKKFNEAKNYWNQLLLAYEKQDKYQSPWVEPAKEKLRLIDVDVK